MFQLLQACDSICLLTVLIQQDILITNVTICTLQISTVDIFQDYIPGQRHTQRLLFYGINNWNRNEKKKMNTIVHVFSYMIFCNQNQKQACKQYQQYFTTKIQ